MIIPAAEIARCDLENQVSAALPVVAADAALVRAGTPGAVVRAKTQVGSRSLLLELEIIAGKANRARLNRAPVRPRELLGIVRVVMFAPEVVLPMMSMFW